MKQRKTQNLMWKTELGKPRGVHKLQNRTLWWRRVQWETRRQQPQGLLRQQTAMELHSHTLSLSCSLLRLHRQRPVLCYLTKDSSYTLKFSLSPYILILFTSVAHKGIFRLFTSIVFRVGSSYITRRDLFPNKLPLHPGMGYCTNLILRRHALNFSASKTLVNMSDPFSVMWTFATTNSPSSTRSPEKDLRKRNVVPKNEEGTHKSARVRQKAHSFPMWYRIFEFKYANRS